MTERERALKEHIDSLVPRENKFWAEFDFKAGWLACAEIKDKEIERLSEKVVELSEVLYGIPSTGEDS